MVCVCVCKCCYQLNAFGCFDSVHKNEGVRWITCYLCAVICVWIESCLNPAVLVMFSLQFGLNKLSWLWVSIFPPQSLFLSDLLFWLFCCMMWLIVCMLYSVCVKRSSLCLADDITYFMEVTSHWENSFPFSI